MRYIKALASLAFQWFLQSHEVLWFETGVLLLAGFLGFMRCGEILSLKKRNVVPAHSVLDLDDKFAFTYLAN